MRLIDAKILEKQVKETFKETSPVLMGQLLRWIRRQPTVDPVPISCMECKHWKRNMHVNTAYGLCRKLSSLSITMHENDFCSKGEPKDDG